MGDRSYIDGFWVAQQLTLAFTELGWVQVEDWKEPFSQHSTKLRYQDREVVICAYGDLSHATINIDVEVFRVKSNT